MPSIHRSETSDDEEDIESTSLPPVEPSKHTDQKLSTLNQGALIDIARNTGEVVWLTVLKFII